MPVSLERDSDVPSFAEQQPKSLGLNEDLRSKLLTIAETIFPAPTKPIFIFQVYGVAR